METSAVRARSLGWRFYLEVVLGSVGLLLFGLTLVWKDWIEIVFRVDPDAGNGAAEYFVCFVLLAVAAAGWWLATTEWREVRRHAAEPKSWMG
jgi:hypothetical protein